MRGGHEEFRAGVTIRGTYRLEQPIGAGGMGWVWAARHLSLGTSVAIKLLARSDSLQPLSLRRFRREVRALAELRSPHVVHVYDTGVEPVPYLVMELLHGETLRQQLERERVIVPQRLVELVEQATHALQLAEQHGIVHRDIKPSNLFIARYNELQVLKVLDFGIAQIRAEAHADLSTGSGVILGSLPYLSPEQARGGTIDARSDLWSLAAVMFRALTGFDAFAAETPPEVLFRICRGERQSATELNPNLPPEIERFFERALAVDPARRFSCAQELAAAYRVLIDPSASSLGSISAVTLAAPKAGQDALARTQATAAWTGPLEPRSARRLRRRRIGGALVGFALCVATATALMPSSSGAPGATAAPPHFSKHKAAQSAPVGPEVAAPSSAAAPSTRLSLRAPAPPNERMAPTIPRASPLSRTSRKPDTTPTKVDVDPVFGLPFVANLSEKPDGAVVEKPPLGSYASGRPPVAGTGRDLAPGE